MASASPPPFQVEDQTDAEFFDNLVVDDDFGVSGSDSVSGDMARALSNLSIGDMGGSVEDLVNGVKVEDRCEGVNVPSSEPLEKDGAVLEESVSVVSPDAVTFDKVVPVNDPAEATGEVGSPGSSTGKSAGSKGTSVKEVQWSSFSSGQGQLDTDVFGSYSDLLDAGSDGLVNTQMLCTENKSNPEENLAAEPSTYFGSLEPQDGQFPGFTNENTMYLNSSEHQNVLAHGAANDQVTSVSDSQYWENLYPGWKYDANTRQWFQVDGYGTMANAQSDGYNTTTVNSQEVFQDNSQQLGDVVVKDLISDISYLQQTSNSLLETVAEGCTTSNVACWHQVSQGSTEYPPNMVFDPQYPGWYYDTNTRQWHSLESYTSSIQTARSAVQSQRTEDVGASLEDLHTEQRATLYNNNNDVSQLENQILQGQGSEELGRDWRGSVSNYSQQNMWQPEPDNKSRPVAGFSGNQQTGSFYSSTDSKDGHANQQKGFKTRETVINHGYGSSNSATAFPGYIPTENLYQFSNPNMEQIQQGSVSQGFFPIQHSTNYTQQSFQSGSTTYSQDSFNLNGVRSSAGRPSHALVTFGFGGKLIVMKDTTCDPNLAYGSQDARRSTILVLNLAEVTEKAEASGFRSHSCDYFHTLCKQFFPGPLVGGNAASKDLYKWIDERITSSDSSNMDFKKGEHLRLLLSLLKISCQHYGKLRSPFGADPSVQETDGPESIVTKLFASARKSDSHLREYGAFTHCMHNPPAEGQIRTTAVEVQNLLVSGRRKEALQCAQEGQLWGPALVLAAQLGEKYYVDTVKQMAHRQFVFGSPLRTLCLLIAGQPADVFSVDNSNISQTGAINMFQQTPQVLANGMLDDWEENLAIITANRTKDDELVIVHLGDCLWKERSEITAAHTCYLIAEANFESYSDSARLCLIGADHWKCPRTYTSPEAIQRTELYEYSKVLGNSQFILLPFQPYKLVYAYMLAEVGKVSDSLKYCQAILKSLKNSARAPEVETWKLSVLSLEECLRTHQQGGYGTNLAPAKIVGKIFNSIDRSIHRMIGAPPPPLPPMPQSNVYGYEHENFSMAPKVSNSQSTMAMSSLIPSASVETISDWTADSKKTRHNRSISEPDFGRSPKQVNSSNDSSADVQNKTSGVPSRFGRIGSQLLQKTMGWVSRSRSDRQAKLGEKNKFYYDEKLKRWVEEGAEPPAEEAALPPPPTTASFQNGVADYNINSAFTSQGLPVNGGLETKASNNTEHSPGIPPIAPSPNQFSGRGRLGVRSRYVDTFNKGGGTPINKGGGTPASSFQSPTVPSVKQGGGAKFFIPTPAASGESIANASESTHEPSSHEDISGPVVKEPSFSSLSLSSSSFSMQRFPSMDNIAPNRNMGMGAALQNGNGSLSSRTRAASWSGSYPDSFNYKMTDIRPSDGLGPSSFAPNNPSPMRPASGSMQANGGSFGDDLHEVEL